MSAPQKPAALRRPATPPQQQKPHAHAGAQPRAVAQPKPTTPQRPAPPAARRAAQAATPRALPQRTANASVQPKAATAAPARQVSAAAQRPTPNAPTPYRPNVNVLQRMRVNNRLTASDAADLAPGITSTDDRERVIGPFSGDRVWIGKAYAYEDEGGEWAIGPDRDGHAGAFTWKLFKKTGKKGWTRHDTLNPDGTRQFRG